ncbi:unnamed protein product, partial [Heterosigma akashiwo]
SSLGTASGRTAARSWRGCWGPNRRRTSSTGLRQRTGVFLPLVSMAQDLPKPQTYPLSSLCATPSGHYSFMRSEPCSVGGTHEARTCEQPTGPPSRRPRAMFTGDSPCPLFASLASSAAWDARGGKSGARFFRTRCGRFVVKFVSRTELQMFNEVAPAYFEYMAKAVFQQVPSALVKILGVYQLGYHNRQTGKRCMEQAVVMQNLFYDRNITKVFDLKGSTRSRYVHVNPEESVDDSSR